MNVTSVSLTYGRKMNLGDFNNAHLELAIGADVQEGDDLNEVAHDLWAMVRQNVKEHALPLLGKGSDPEAAFLGLPSQIDRWRPKGGALPATLGDADKAQLDAELDARSGVIYPRRVVGGADGDEWEDAPR